MNVSLWVGDDDVVFGEELIEAKAYVAFGHAQAAFHVGLYPEVHVKDEGVVTKVFKDDLYFGVGEHTFLFFGGLSHEFGDFLCW